MNKPITADLIMSLKPCDRWPEERVREVVPRPISVVEFLKVKHIPAEDRIWVVLHKEILQIELTVLFAQRCADAAANAKSAYYAANAADAAAKSAYYAAKSASYAADAAYHAAHYADAVAHYYAHYAASYAYHASYHAATAAYHAVDAVAHYAHYAAVRAARDARAAAAHEERQRQIDQLILLLEASDG